MSNALEALSSIPDWCKDIVAQYADVSKKTVKTWCSGETLPTRGNLLALRSALVLMGYEITEFEALPQPAQVLANMITLDVISAEKAAEALGYTNLASLYRVTVDGAGLLSERATKLSLIAEQHRDSYEAAIKQFQADCQKAQQQDAPKVPDEGNGDKSAITAVHIIIALAAIVDTHSNDVEFRNALSSRIGKKLPAKVARFLDEIVQQD